MLNLDLQCDTSLQTSFDGDSIPWSIDSFGKVLMVHGAFEGCRGAVDIWARTIFCDASAVET